MADKKTLAEVTADAQALFAEIQSKGINAADRPSIVTAAKNLIVILNNLQPHINDAHTAFGNQDTNVKKLSDLRNSLNKIVATYSS